MVMNVMKRLIVILAILLFSTYVGAQTIENVRFVRNDKELTINYTLDKRCDILVRVSVDGGESYSYPLQNLSGDVGKNVTPGEKQIIAYDLFELRGIADSLDSALVRFKVEVDDGSVDVVFGNLLIPMVPVEGGTFTMGCTHPNAVKHNYEADVPKHKVTVKSFYMCKYEVTQQLWTAVMDTNPSRWQDNDSLPVEQVSWNDVQIFIARISQLTGRRFRLPTEAEWEYAARGGNKSKRYVYPGTSGDAGDCCWYCVNSKNRTHPVGQKKPNELGLYDMGGNVLEWCSDWMGEYSEEPQENPQGPKYGENKILRGGCMSSPSWGCSVSSRSWYFPDYGYGYNGFRLVLDTMVVEEGD